MVAVSLTSPLAARDNVELAALSKEKFISIPHKDRGGLSYLVANLCLEQGSFRYRPGRCRANHRS